jgi:catechol 2,3-dioxygenase-like lactoylglutathione lyase family enzyme
VRAGAVGEDPAVDRGRLARLLGVRIAAAELESGTRGYTLLLGPPARSSPERARFELGNGIVEVVPGGPASPALLVACDGETASRDFAGLSVVRDGGPPPGDVPAATRGPVAIDHVVVATRDPERAVALWRDAMGFRLALDREFPDRGLRMIFLRSGGITLEVTAPLRGEASDAPDAIFGVAYRVADLEACRRELAAAGVDVSEVRRGRKPGTAVVTVRSHTENVPTLLIRDPSRDESDRRSTPAGERL